MIVDKICIQQVIGCLMKKPQLLSEIDKYTLTPDDFSTKFEKSLFVAINGLYAMGAIDITPMDIEDYLSSSTGAAQIFKQYNGLEYLQDIEEFCSVENFSYYYSKLKKMNLLRDFKKMGFDISDFYIEDLTDPRALEVNSNFEALTIKDIIDRVKKKLARLDSEYAKTNEITVEKVADGIDDFFSSLKECNEIGLPIQGKIINHVISGAQRGCLTIRSASSGTGKALPNSTVIPTPRGWRRVDEIQVGDELFDALGKPTKVLGVYPQGEKEVYEVLFKDGRTAKCCDEHLWSYNTRGQKDYSKTSRKFFTKTLREIIDTEKLQGDKGEYRILVPMQKAIQYEEKKHFLPPYVFGLLLGDGSFRQHPTNKALHFSSENSELPDAIGSVMGWIVKKNSGKNYTWYFATEKKLDYSNKKVNIWVEDALKEHPELINTDNKTKFIPRDYIEDSVENRFALLQGMMDSNGSVDVKGRTNYFTISEQLRDGFIEVAQSLGFKTHVSVDTHKETNIGYIVSIQGAPQDKVRLFRIKRKKERIENWANGNHRFEANTHNPIIKITKLGYSEEMTCFYVDNKEHLFLTENFVVTHNTRIAVSDACFLAYPIRFNWTKCKWEQTGNSEKVLFVITEQQVSQVKRMILAYLTDINESRFTYGQFTEMEEKVIEQAIELIKEYAENFIIVRIPDPSIELVKTLVRENCLIYDIGYVFYDYIFVSTGLLSEFRGFSLRNDELLLLFATALKDLAVELDVCMFTSTQVNANVDDNKNIRNEASLAGGRSTINKADNGMIMARPTKDELDILETVIQSYGLPNLVTDVFKVRSGQWTQVRIWSIVDLGRMKREDLFITDSRLEVIQSFDKEDFYTANNWDSEEYAETLRKVEELNGLLRNN